MAESSNNERDRHALPLSIIARSSRFADHQSVQDALTRPPRMDVDSHLHVSRIEDGKCDLIAMMSAEPPHIDTSIGEVLTLSPSQESQEPLMRGVNWGRDRVSPHVGFVDDVGVIDETEAWRERVRRSEGEGDKKRAWSKRLSDGVVEFGAKVARKVASVSQHLLDRPSLMDEKRNGGVWPAQRPHSPLRHLGHWLRENPISAPAAASLREPFSAPSFWSRYHPTRLPDALQPMCD